jgi:AhpD family alkylhydroperoxidase
MENQIKLLIAVGSAITANCQPCLQHLMREARDSGAEEKEIMEAMR